MSKMSTAKEIANEVSVVANCYSGTEDMLIPAPLVIATLGKLTLIANKGCDFSLSEPSGGLRFIHWPKSFRASLFEVTGKAQDAFLLAGKNMTAIQLQCQNITGCFQEATKILIKLSDEELHALLPMPLNQIQTATKICLEKAWETEKAYKDVLDMTQELQTATINTDKETADQLLTIKKTRAALFAAEDRAQQQKTDNDRRLKDLEETMTEARNMFKDSLASSDKMVAVMAVAEYAQTLVSSTVVPLVHAKYGVNPVFQQNQQHAESTEDQSEGFEDISAKEEKAAAKLCAYTKAGFILKQWEDLVSACIYKHEDGTESINDEGVNSQDDVQCMASFQQLKRELAKLQSKNKTSKRIQRIMDICAEGFKICSLIEKYRNKPGTVNKDELIKKIKQ